MLFLPGSLSLLEALTTQDEGEPVTPPDDELSYTLADAELDDQLDSLDLAEDEQA